MHVLLVNYAYSADLRSARALLERYQALSGWAEALLAAGARVTVLQRFHQDTSIKAGAISYQFATDRHGPRLRGWQIAGRLHRMARAQCLQSAGRAEPVVIHVNGLVFPLQVRALRALIPGQAAIAVQHHAGLPWPGWRGWLQRWGLAGADGYLFADRALAAPFVQQGVIPSLDDVFPVMAGSSWFEPQKRVAARASTGMYGDPVCLWVGRLNENKDPLTVLAGFERVLQQAPGMRLYMAYGDGDLLPQVRSRLASSAALSRAVELLGCIPHADLESHYNSADYFLLGSHHESSGFALAEALACGVVPVVTDIPSFQTMTGSGRIGALWPPGDAARMAEALLRLQDLPLAPQSAAARAFFEERLSLPAIGRQALAIYGELLDRRAGKVK
jgi:glycosyltransferase involved in cell wall biosynthesis